MRARISLEINKRQKIKRREKRKKKVKEKFITEVILNIQSSCEEMEEVLWNKIKKRKK